MELADGQSAATLTLVIHDDGLPEADEVSVVTLVEIVEGGSSLEGRGASLGERRSATLIVLANDSPHGVVRWERATYVTSEPQGTDSTVTLFLLREQGSQGHIRAEYM